VKIIDHQNDIPWKLPWQSLISDYHALELKREVSNNHPLFGQNLIAIGQRVDCDDVLFYLPQYSLKFAVVHLTWSGKKEDHPYPSTSFYATLEDWIEHCLLPDCSEYS
jgi:hypothetical protein